MTFYLLHQKALNCVKNIRTSEFELLEILIIVDRNKHFRDFGHSSLYGYCVDSLKLSENEAFSLIKVARKSKEVPRLREVIRNHELTVSQCRRITSVITKDNCDEWINKSKTMKQKEIEKEIAKVNPKEAVRESFLYVQENRVKMTVGISEELMQKLIRIKDLLSQKKGSAVTLEEALEKMAEDLLQKHDPVKRADRILPKIKRQALRPEVRKPTAVVRHEVARRDKGQCAYVDATGKRCGELRWTELHHQIPFSQGGSTTTDNLKTLCFSHHRATHENRLLR